MLEEGDRSRPWLSDSLGASEEVQMEPVCISLFTLTFFISNSRKILNSAKVQMSHSAYNRKNHRTPRTTLDVSSKEKCVYTSCMYCWSSSFKSPLWIFQENMWQTTKRKFSDLCPILEWKKRMLENIQLVVWKIGAHLREFRALSVSYLNQWQTSKWLQRKIQHWENRLWTYFLAYSVHLPF